jgi:hypothetical protein
MLNKEEFIRFILAEPKGRSAPSTKATGKKAKPEADALGGYGFGDEVATPEPSTTAETTFARQLLEASGFGAAQYLATSEVILGGDPAAQHLPERVYYWPKAVGRPYQTILFELTQPSSALLNAPLFKPLKGVLEDALTRLVQDTLKGFEIGGERRKADVKQGKQDETLCVVSIRDERDKESGTSNLICFGTVARGEGSLETFHIREAARFWEPQLAQDHLERLYDRHFKKLASEKWQDAFISGEERKLARKLMDVSHGKKTDESKIQEAVVDLLEEIALSYGLRKKPSGRRLEATDLPQDHDIGINDGAAARGGKNPFRGMTLRDEKYRLLGYIIYCLDNQKDAEVLRAHLEKNNRFHNVLVVYPNGDSTDMELWQGNKPLQGKLTKRGAKFEGEGQVVNLLSRFFVVSKALVSNPAELAAELAYRARYLRGFALRELEKPELLRDKDLSKLYNSFHDIFLKGEEKGKDKAEVEAKKHDEFADSYAQTLTYGLLSARWISKDELVAKGERFTLDNATGLLERTSPFFKELFTQVISQSHDAARDWLLQDITDLLDRIDIDAVFSGVQDDVLLGHDPVMHFYEPFLAAYDAAIKRQRGVFYTPHPVVSYIVRSVHELLQTEFGLEDGLAATITWGEMVKKHKDLKLPPYSDEPGDQKTISPDEPFVQILDPATGTATFLVEVIDVIYRTLVAKWTKQGFTEAKINAAWNEYVPKHLLPRLYGYELMMAPYAIAHLKIGIKLAETGYKFTSKQRANVYLTNALEPAHDFSGRLEFDAPALAHEAAAVNKIKRHKRFTVVIGNPPYSGISSNMSEQAQRIVDAYKFVDGAPLDEKKLWLQDDYVKFIRKAQTTIENTHLGVLGLITNNGYLDNPTFRGMRQSLMNTFVKLSLLDLHGNSSKKEESPDGTEDKNVFEIKQGVSICLGIHGVGAPSIRHADLWGSKEFKYEWLSKESVASTKFVKLAPSTPDYTFAKQDAVTKEEYSVWISVWDAYRTYGTGIVTGRDALTTNFEKSVLLKNLKRFADLSEEDARREFSLGPDARDWKIPTAQKDLKNNPPSSEKLVEIQYRPFDRRWTHYTGSARGINASPCRSTMVHMLKGENLGLITARSNASSANDHFFVTRNITEAKCGESSRQCALFPLRVFHEQSHTEGLNFGEESESNFSEVLLKSLSRVLSESKALTPEDIFNYTYAVFHSPGYRSRYAEFLKIDFPRLPLTGSIDLFRELAKLGGELVALHLLEAKILDNPRSKFLGQNRVVSKVGWTTDNGGTVWIDCKGSGEKLKPGTSGFVPVPEEVWNFHIGGYQVCHKWLKDRKDRTLSDEDIAHYHKIVIALTETIRLMAEIDQVINEHGGWPNAFNNAD